MAKKAKRKKPGRGRRIAFGVLVGLAVASVAFFLLLRNDSGISTAENAIGSVFAPVENAFGSVTKYFRDLTQGMRDYNAMSYENELLKREVQDLKLEIATLEDAAIENGRLESLLEAKQRLSDQDPVYATVIARSPGVWFDTFSINRGSVDEIKVGMTVVTGDGLVGRVIEVGLAYSKVMSIIDTRSRTTCLVERTREPCIMYGEIMSNSVTPECKMYYVPSVNTIKPGDKVITAGTDGVFPKGLTVGYVTQVSRPSETSDQYVVVMPSVNFMSIEEVLVLRTEVEKVDEALPALPTPSPRPTPVATPTPLPTTNANAGDLVDENAPWERPTLPPDGQIGDSLMAEPTPSPTPESTIQPGQLPEDLWSGED